MNPSLQTFFFGGGGESCVGKLEGQKFDYCIYSKNYFVIEQYIAYDGNGYCD